MFTIDISFRKKGRRSPEDLDSIGGLLIALIRNGQIEDRHLVVTPVRGGYRATIGVPEADSLRTSRHNSWVRKALRALDKGGLALGKITHVGEEPDSTPPCTCRKPPSLIMATDMFSTESPFSCGKCGGLVPLYRLPFTDESKTYEDVCFWARDYRAFDTLWIASGSGERLACRELSRPDSELSRGGREICRTIEEKRGTPTYYALQRYYGRSLAAERRLRCPECGKAWLVDPPWLGYYDFRCARCRLVSHFADELT